MATLPSVFIIIFRLLEVKFVFFIPFLEFGFLELLGNRFIIIITKSIKITDLLIYVLSTIQNVTPSPFLFLLNYDKYINTTYFICLLSVGPSFVGPFAVLA